MNTKQWLDLNEINDYIEDSVGENNISPSTLRRWITAEAAHSGSDSTKAFANAGLGSKKPVTKYRLDVVNNMITHNLSRIQKKVDGALVTLDTPSLVSDVESLRQLFAKQQQLLQQMHRESQTERQLLQKSLNAQLWLSVMKLQLDYDSPTRVLDGTGLYHTLLAQDTTLEQLDIERFVTQVDDSPAGRKLAQSMRLGQPTVTPEADDSRFSLPQAGAPFEAPQAGTDAHDDFKD